MDALSTLGSLILTGAEPLFRDAALPTPAEVQEIDQRRPATEATSGSDRSRSYRRNLPIHLFQSFSEQ